jgi:transketolase
MRELYLDLLFNYAKANKNVVIITGDLGFGALDNFFKELPDQIYNLGIAEQSIVSIAAGLASEGKDVFIYSIANFISLRVLEQIRNDLCYHRLPVKILAIGTGYSYGQLGFSHHGTEDVSAVRSLPGIMILNPADYYEAKMVFDLMLDSEVPVYIRLDKNNSKLHSHDLKKSLAPVKILGDGKTAIFVSGRILAEVMETIFSEKELVNDIKLFSCPVIKPLKLSYNYLNSFKPINKIILIEEHNLSGGFGSMILEELVDAKFNIKLDKIVRIGIDDVYSSDVGERDYLLTISRVLKRLKDELRSVE